MIGFNAKRMTNGIADAFPGINTVCDCRRWLGQGGQVSSRKKPDGMPPAGGMPAADSLRFIETRVVHAVRQTLIQQETDYHLDTAEETFSSLWAHSARVARIAFRIAGAEGLAEEPALLAGLLHDIGKFACGSYHEDDIPEERNAVPFVKRILSGTVYERWIPTIEQAILSMYLEGEATTDIGRVVHDADNLDKLGNMGVVQFFTKKALRRQFLDNDVLIRAGVELTYAHHAQDTLKTATGRSLARERGIRTRRFYTELLEEWAGLGLGTFDILEEDIAGIACILVVPCACTCAGRLEIDSDIRDSVKCRSVVVTYHCQACGIKSEFSFCLPKVKGLPRKS